MSTATLLILIAVWLINIFIIGKLLANACISVWRDAYEARRDGLKIGWHTVALAALLFPASLINYYLFGDDHSGDLCISRYPPFVSPSSRSDLFFDVTEYRIWVACLWPIRLAIVPVNMVWAVWYLVGRVIGQGIYSYFD